MEHDFLGPLPNGKFPGVTEHLKWQSFFSGSNVTNRNSCSISSKPSLIPVSDLRGRFLINGTDLYKWQPVPGSQDSGETSFSRDSQKGVKRNAKNARGLGRDRALSPIFPSATAPFPKSLASYFQYVHYTIREPGTGQSFVIIHSLRRHTVFFCECCFPRTHAEYSYFSAGFRLKIFLYLIIRKLQPLTFVLGQKLLLMAMAHCKFFLVASFTIKRKE